MKTMAIDLSAADSDSVNLGSNPGPPAIVKIGIYDENTASTRPTLRTKKAKSAAHKSAQRDWCLIYFFRCHAFIKIGYALDPPTRLSTMNAGNPYPIEIAAMMVGGKNEEAFLHALFKGLRQRGEWFREEGLLADLLKEIEGSSDPEETRQAASDWYYKKIFISDKTGEVFPSRSPFPPLPIGEIAEL